MKRRYKHGTVFILRYRVRKPEGGWIEKSETLNGCKNKKAALRELANRLKQDSSDIPEKAPEPPSMKFSELVKTHWRQYLDNANVKPSTLYAYDSKLKTWINPFFEDRVLGEIDPSCIGNFMAHLAAEKLSTKYRRNIYNIVKLIFDIAVENDLIGASPVRPKVHRPKVIQEEKRSLSFKQAQALLKAVDAAWKVPVFTLALTGIRAGELLALQWQNLDFLQDQITIKHSLWRKQLMTPKNAKKRVIGMPVPLKQILSQHRSSSQFTDPDDFVFCQADGHPIDPDSLRRYGIYPALERAGIPFVKRASGCHLFRHLAGSIIHRKTGSLKLAQKQLGHSTVSTTGDIYTHVEESEIQDAAEVLGEALGLFCGRTVVENAETEKIV